LRLCGSSLEYIAAETGAVNNGVYAANAASWTAPKTIVRNPLQGFWDFYTNKAGPPAWGSKLFRYLPDEQAVKMYRAVQLAAS
jgi:hypothetical protein